jgi:hypothetical protein
VLIRLGVLISGGYYSSETGSAGGAIGLLNRVRLVRTQETRAQYAPVLMCLPSRNVLMSDDADVSVEIALGFTTPELAFL